LTGFGEVALRIGFVGGLLIKAVVVVGLFLFFRKLRSV